MEYNVTDDKSWTLFAIVLKLHLVQHVSLRETLLRTGYCQPIDTVWQKNDSLIVDI